MRGHKDRGRCKAGRGRRLQTFAADQIGLEIFADAAGRVALWRLIALQALAFGIATAPAGAAFGLMLPSRPLLPRRSRRRRRAACVRLHRVLRRSGVRHSQMLLLRALSWFWPRGRYSAPLMGLRCNSMIWRPARMVAGQARTSTSQGLGILDADKGNIFSSRLTPRTFVRIWPAEPPGKAVLAGRCGFPAAGG